ncbi:Putative S-adenosyl-L-methionine-dependent methyltransferase [Frankliniella fusca]|uniref:S-adenosyl-L-methionine-dependent methyltransferase n=1 Tax=Frankliniella fusca TaxID=407009 RepID=A0AAE1L8V6_9NEOP|nr:Putative S-adenosyl-L-methionine-dependent methyltransferase [Frankliniella fusca]
MVEQLGLPTLFMALRSADLHWPDLFRLFTERDDIKYLLIKNSTLAVEYARVARASTMAFSQVPAPGKQ